MDSAVHTTAELKTPQSPHQILAGTLIRAALLTAINSDLPGQIVASVVENVFDTITGTTLLIPQGARLLGEYDSDVAYGQERVLLAWTRLIMPDGSSIVLDQLPGVDAAGRAGLHDSVDWHWRRIFAGAAVSTLIGAGAELAAPDRTGSDERIVVSARDSVQETVNAVGQEITRRNLNIKPTLTVRAGSLVQVIVNKDIVLRRYGENASWRTAR